MTKLFNSACIGLVTMTLAACQCKQPLQPAATETVKARVVESRLEQMPITVRTTGTLRARESAVLSAQVMGRVRQVTVRQGDTVHAGQTLVVLDDATLRSSTEQADAMVKAATNQQAAAQANADLAASTLARYKELQAQKSISSQEFDEVSRKAEAAASQVDALRSQVAAAKAQQDSARSMLGYTHILAPFDGVVTSRMVDPGALASPGIPLIQVDSSGPLQLETGIPESAMVVVRRGMRVAVTINGAADMATSGVVAEIVPAADAASHAVTVKIDLAPAKDLRAGMYATAQIPVNSKQAVLALRSAVVRRGSLSCIYVLDARGVVQLRYVTLGNLSGNEVEVLSGLAAGEKLVDDPADRDLAGKRIEVEP